MWRVGFSEPRSVGALRGSLRKSESGKKAPKASPVSSPPHFQVSSLFPPARLHARS